MNANCNQNITRCFYLVRPDFYDKVWNIVFRRCYNELWYAKFAVSTKVRCNSPGQVILAKLIFVVLCLTQSWAVHGFAQSRCHGKQNNDGFDDQVSTRPLNAHHCMRTRVFGILGGGFEMCAWRRMFFFIEKAQVVYMYISHSSPADNPRRITKC